MTNKVKSFKPVLDFLRMKFDKNVVDVQPLIGGERSKVYVFNIRSSKYILRINDEITGFRKDMYAYKRYSSHVPIPKMIRIGKFEDKYYAISEFCVGQILTDNNKKLPSTLVENIITTLDAIHNAVIPNDGAYGIADIHGKAQFKSFKDWLMKDYILVSKEDGGFYTWKDVYNVSFVNNKIGS